MNKAMTKAERTKQFIIEQAAPLLMKNGIAGTAMSDIMAATRLAKGSLYVHFENKEELSYAVVDHNLEMLGKKMLEGSNRQSSSKGKILLLLKILGDPLNTPLEGGCPMLNFGIEADDTNPAVLKKVAKTIKNIQQATASLVRQGIANGEFNKNWNADVFATKSFALIEGGILLSRVTGKSEQMKVIIKIIRDEIEEMSL